MAFVRWIFALPVIVACVFLALSNRNDITFTYSPLHEPAEIPLYFTILAALAVGFLFGAIVSWFSMGKVRSERRRQKKDIKRLQKELDAALEAANENTIKTIGSEGNTLIESKT